MTTSKLQPSILQEHAHQDELGIKVARICPKSGQISCNYGGMSSKNIKKWSFRDLTYKMFITDW